MSVCKYMSAKWGLEYLKSWRLKITPPAEFNDPFELKPPAGEVLTASYLKQAVEDSVVEIALGELAKFLIESSPGLPQDLATDLARECVRGPHSHAFNKLAMKVHKRTGLSKESLRNIAHIVSTIWPRLLENTKQGVAAARTPTNGAIERMFRESLPARLGVLCLSKNINQPLMWAHYADSHRGLLIELEPGHPAFRRKRTEKDEFGSLCNVTYTKQRPTLTMEVINQHRAFEVFALTKSFHWSYEEEQRMVWPLELCETVADGKVSLIDIPPSAVLSVTLGCNATEETKSALLDSLARKEECAHIQVRQAMLHETEFELIYEPIAR